MLFVLIWMSAKSLKQNSRDVRNCRPTLGCCHLDDMDSMSALHSRTQRTSSSNNIAIQVSTGFELFVMQRTGASFTTMSSMHIEKTVDIHIT